MEVHFLTDLYLLKNIVVILKTMIKKHLLFVVHSMLKRKTVILVIDLKLTITLVIHCRMTMMLMKKIFLVVFFIILNL
jgi:hypothetical protein